MQSGVVEQIDKIKKAAKAIDEEMSAWKMKEIIDKRLYEWFKRLKMRIIFSRYIIT